MVEAMLAKMATRNARGLCGVCATPTTHVMSGVCEDCRAKSAPVPPPPPPRPTKATATGPASSTLRAAFARSLQASSPAPVRVGAAELLPAPVETAVARSQLARATVAATRTDSVDTSKPVQARDERERLNAVTTARHIIERCTGFRDDNERAMAALALARRWLAGDSTARRALALELD